MRCPFLREAQVKFCRASVFRKMIVRLPEQPENERCSSRDYVNCPSAKQRLEEHPSVDHCPFLHESLVQYCSAAAVTQYIPYTESVLSQCGTDSHKYCELFHTLAQPNDGMCECDIPQKNGNKIQHLIDDVNIPSNLFYSPNHMWLDIGNDGVNHIGIDAFLAKVLGSAENITFLATKGFQRPTVSFSVHGVELQFIFPIPFNITRSNTYLRTNTGKIFSNPYTIGWLFETTDDKTKNNSERTEGLISGAKIYPWMKKEMERMTSLAHIISSKPEMNGSVLMADGGIFQIGFAQQLTREELLTLYNNFFAPMVLWKEKQ